jgi:integrase
MNMVMLMIDSEFNIDSDPTFKEFLDTRNLRPRTRDNYQYHLINYCKLINKTPTELIEDAGKEESEGIRMRSRKIRRYLKRFLSHYEERGFSPAHIKIGLIMVRSFYNNFEINLPKTRSSRIVVEEDDKKGTIEDLPTLEEIQKALEYANPTYKAIILLMVSSGMGRAEIISLTVQDFIRSIQDYFDKPITLPLDIEWIHQKLDKINAPVATWKIRRIKTSEKQTTFSTPESVFAILNTLGLQPPENIERKLFIPRKYSDSDRAELDPSAFSKTFQRINDKCRFGKLNGQSKFRSHSLRKFFASQLMKTNLGQYNIDLLLGHKVKKPVQAAYFKQDIQHLRLEYRSVMDAVTITNKVEIVNITDAKVEEMEKEVNSLRQANEYMAKQYEKMSKEMHEFMDYIENGDIVHKKGDEPVIDDASKSIKLSPRKIPKDKKIGNKKKYVTY